MQVRYRLDKILYMVGSTSNEVQPLCNQQETQRRVTIMKQNCNHSLRNIFYCYCTDVISNVLGLWLLLEFSQLKILLLLSVTCMLNTIQTNICRHITENVGQSFVTLLFLTTIITSSTYMTKFFIVVLVFLNKRCQRCSPVIVELRNKYA